ncbi:MAG: aspartate/glutamate racemase family protein [Lachnospiraceae bacterium]|nr:aspartate/glutamate racemase family protein [Lachnospiraceae bacterium]
MKTIGLIGGMSWESTVTYYQIINETVRDGLGGLHSAKILLYSVEFAEIEECQAKGEWERSGEILADAAMRLESAGADFIVICTNTMHKVVSQIQAKIKIPIIHIADVTAEALLRDGITRVALLGTKYTMTQDFYKERLVQRGISVMIPNEKEIEKVNDVIYNELCCGIVSGESRDYYFQLIMRLKEEGAQAVILGCTEIGLLIGQTNSVLPVYDTTWIHARTAAEKAMER